MPGRSRLLTVAIVVALSLIGGADARARDLRPEVLSFENGNPARWSPTGAFELDTAIVHGGRASGRLTREPGTSGEFASISLNVPLDFAGDSLELRGWLRLDQVVGYAGLWQRQDGATGVRQFDNMHGRALAGTVEWAEYRVKLPLDPRARTLVIGALLVGTGRLWVDDLQLFVDGTPLASVPEKPVPKTALDHDHEFDGGSKLALASVTELQAEHLYLLGKVWGFLKYHHPRVTGGALHWDYELFRVAPRVLAARDRAAARRVLTRWVDGLGRVRACTRCAASPEGRPVLPRIGWLADEALLGRELAARLRHVHANRESLDTQFYVELTPGVGNPILTHEAEYTSTTLPDAGYRLLALFRFWNVIEYWFPYRDLIEEDWDAVLREFIPSMLAQTSRDAYKLDLIRLSARVHDGHANLWRSLQLRPPVGKCRAPVVVRFAEGRAVVSGYSNPRLGPACGLEVGDVIASVDGVPVDSLIARWRPWYAASNEAARLRDIAGALTQGACDSVRLALERDGSQRIVLVPRAHGDSLDWWAGAQHDRPGETFRRVSDDLAYLKLSTVKALDAPSYVRQAAGAQCLLVDIRNYPSQFVVFALGSLLVPQRTEFAVFTSGDLGNPGSFGWTAPVALEPAEPRFAGRVAILVDEMSQSQAEYTAMALRAAPGAVVVGSTTAGADGNVSAIPLPGGIQGMMSGIGVFYPDRRPTQRVGIQLDVAAPPTIAGIRAGRDEVIESAVLHVLGRELTDPERRALELPPRARP